MSAWRVILADKILDDAGGSAIADRLRRHGYVVHRQLSLYAFQRHADIDGDALGADLVELVEEGLELDCNGLQARLAAGRHGASLATGPADRVREERPETTSKTIRGSFPERSCKARERRWRSSQEGADRFGIGARPKDPRPGAR